MMYTALWKAENLYLVVLRYRMKKVFLVIQMQMFFFMQSSHTLAIISLLRQMMFFKASLYRPSIKRPRSVWKLQSSSRSSIFSR